MSLKSFLEASFQHFQWCTHLLACKRWACLRAVHFYPLRSWGWSDYLHYSTIHPCNTRPLCFGHWPHCQHSQKINSWSTCFLNIFKLYSAEAGVGSAGEMEKPLRLSWTLLDRTLNSSTMRYCKLWLDVCLGHLPAWCLRQYTESLTSSANAWQVSQMGWGHTSGWKRNSTSCCSFGLQAANLMTTFILSLNCLGNWCHLGIITKSWQVSWTVSGMSNRWLWTACSGPGTCTHIADCHATVKKKIIW